MTPGKLVPQGLTHIEYLHVTPFPDLLHQSQRLPFGHWDSANDDNAWHGQHLADRLDKSLAEQLHLPNLINDTHSVFGTTARTCLWTRGTVAGAAKSCDLGSGGLTLMIPGLHLWQATGLCLTEQRNPPHAQDMGLRGSQKSLLGPHLLPLSSSQNVLSSRMVQW